MTSLQWVIGIVVMLGISALLFIPFAGLIILGDPLLIGLWTVLMILGIALMIKYSIRLMAIGKMVLLSFFGNMYGIYSSQIPKKNGMLDTGILPIFPFVVQAYVLPEGVFLVSMESNTAYTLDEDDDPTATVRVYAHIQVQLKLSLETVSKLMKVMPGSDKVYDFTEIVMENFYVGQPNSPQPKVQQEKCVRLARYLRTLLQTPFDEAVGQAIPFFPLREALKDTPKIEEKIKERLNTPGTAFKKREIEQYFDVFDINLIAVSPTDPKVLSAITAKGVAVREGKATVETAKAQATAIKIVAKATQKPGGELTMAAKTMEKIPNVTMFAGSTSILEAGAAVLTKQQNGGPKPPEPTTKQPEPNTKG